MNASTGSLHSTLSDREHSIQNTTTVRSLYSLAMVNKTAHDRLSSKYDCLSSCWRSSTIDRFVLRGEIKFGRLGNTLTSNGMTCVRTAQGRAGKEIKDRSGACRSVTRCWSTGTNNRHSSYPSTLRNVPVVLPLYHWQWNFSTRAGRAR